MPNKIIYTCFLLLVIIIQSCKTVNQTVVQQPSTKREQANPVPELYRASNPIINELVHTKLDVRFDWVKKYLYGKATLTLQPHFYSTQSLILNARGMTISEVSMMQDSIRIHLVYEYRNDSLLITLDKEYLRGEPYDVSIEYIAKPDELIAGGSAAIRSDKGLYFINPDGKHTTKPKQIWTQGETQASSVWFPTIDAPNQKMTQEISITIDTTFVTLSNGVLTKSTDNDNGTRTDYWKMLHRHSPYLVMMVIGNFAVVKDSWRDKEVSYYVEPEYKNVARKIFGNTPEMMEFFSKRLGVDYAWDKYAQVVVRDYVSGAMENTTATLFGEFMQQDEREMLDGNYEDVISHELFHQWFGDLVTAESWSNLPLNESFATYGEYLWNEYKYGREKADAGLREDLTKYLREAKTKQVNLVRFQYEAQEDMFDRHSYQKGGCVLHMLRKHIGDHAFFASLKLYLEKNRFQPAEIHHLRLAFEETTGEDLNWFFNQWFLDKGHPVLDINYSWDDEKKQQHVVFDQLQNFKTTGLFKLPMKIDIYANGKVSRQSIVFDSARQEFIFQLAAKPDLVNVDAEKMLICAKTDHHTIEEWMYMYNNAPLYLDRMEALQQVAIKYAAGTAESRVMMDALNDSNPDLRTLAIKNIQPVALSSDSTGVKAKLIEMALHDKKSFVRDEALIALAEHFKGGEVAAVIKSAIKDSSYTVMGTALDLLTDHNESEGLSLAREVQKENNKNLSAVLSSIYAEYGNDEDDAFMQNYLSAADGIEKYSAVQLYGKFLLRCKNESNISKGIYNLQDVGKNADAWYVRFSAMQTLSELSKAFGEEKGNNKEMYESLKRKTDEVVTELKKNEKDENIRKILDTSGQ